ncbi:MAG: ribose 5-phosphate isomerase B [Deltaproteobacteria bacterium]|nr:ribose 5-phosphate isomerase B [Deltaproteobacteria bacterium]
MLIASDHGGLELKQIIVKFLQSRGVEVNDLGVHADDSVDYPDYAALVATPISNGDEKEGILVCGTGIGMSIAANKFSGVRAALVHDEFTAQMAREHNNANILVMVDVWLNGQFEGGRHQNRLNKIIQLSSEDNSDK